MLFLALVALCVTAQAEEPKVCGAPVALNDGWGVAAQADVGFDSAKLCELDSFVAQWPEANIHAVAVVRNGKLVMERYFAGEDERWGDKLGRVAYGPEVKHDLRSISKSVTSLLVGIARSEGKFPALDSSVFNAFPDYADLRTPEKARITFQDLLTMSSGLAWDENRPWTDPRNNEAGMILAADPFRYILSQPVAYPPGMVYAYSGGGTSLLGETLVRSTGRSLRDYARDKLFTPLDITDFEWLDAGISGKLGAFGACDCGHATPPNSAACCRPTASGTGNKYCLPDGPPNRSSRASTARACSSTAISGGSAAPSATAPSSPGSPASAWAASASTSCRRSTPWS